MSLARDTLREGNVSLTLEQLKQEVRKAPRDSRLRTFLFQMFCITGEWDRALTQLGVVHELDPAAQAMMQTYQAAIRCEMLREKVFAGRRTPTVFGDPGDWVPLLIEANRLLATGQPEHAAALREAAFDAAPECEATLNGKPYAWVADADPRLGPVMEVIIEGRYVWVPYARIKAIKFDLPEDLRDQVWMPATFRWTNDGEVVGFVPTRYPGSAASTNPAVQLARRTEWIDHSPDWALPMGQRMLVSDDDETALMEIRVLAMTQPGPEAPDTTAAATTGTGTPAEIGSQ